ncbi:MAG TPA: hypothetical protein VGC85_02060 [Chthoniobacterales bacterium]|jgi:hypothetical protein
MKKHLLLGLLIAAVGLGTAAAQSQTFTAGTGQRGQQTQRRGQQPQLRRGAIGAFPRAARGNPLQLLNPAAPAKYFGPPQDTVTVATEQPYGDPYTRNYVTGLILFGIAW